MSAPVRPASPAPKPENLWLNLVFNIALPVLVLSKLSGEKGWGPLPGLGPVGGLLAALAFPLGYQIQDLVRRRHWNALSLLSLTSVLLTGGLGLLRLDPFWFAVKEAAVPLAIGAAVLLSSRTQRPLVRVLLYNPQVIDTEAVDAALDERGARAPFERLMHSSTLLVAASFLLSAGLNFLLARWLVTAAPRTELFNEQLAQLNLWSWPVIALPSMAVMVFALWRLLRGIQTLTGRPMDAFLRGQKQEPPASA